MSERKAIVTITVASSVTIGQVMVEMMQLTTPSMVKYAHRIGADFLTINSVVVSNFLEGDIRYEKYQLYDLLEIYDRVCLIDLDAVVFNRAPDIFEAVDPLKLGILRCPGQISQRMIKRSFSMLPPIYWGVAYFNTGVIVVPKCCQYLFEYRSGRNATKVKKLAEQNSVNYRIHKFNAAVQELDPRFHCVPAYASTYPIEGDPYILHWAGGARGKQKAEEKLAYIRGQVEALKMRGKI